MTAKIFQNNIKEKLENIFCSLEAKDEWVAFTGIPTQYSPRVDIAISPFSTTSNESKSSEYNELLRQQEISHFLEQIYEFHKENVLSFENDNNTIPIPVFDDLKNKNMNARCFIAIEIENSSSKKHIMGSVINASSLGKVGIGVAYTQSALRTFIRILSYLRFLESVNKTTYDASNFLIVTKEQIDTIL